MLTAEEDPIEEINNELSSLAFKDDGASAVFSYCFSIIDLWIERQTDDFFDSGGSTITLANKTAPSNAVKQIQRPANVLGSAKPVSTRVGSEIPRDATTPKVPVRSRNLFEISPPSPDRVLPFHQAQVEPKDQFGVGSKIGSGVVPSFRPANTSKDIHKTQKAKVKRDLVKRITDPLVFKPVNNLDDAPKHRSTNTESGKMGVGLSDTRRNLTASSMFIPKRKNIPFVTKKKTSSSSFLGSKRDAERPRAFVPPQFSTNHGGLAKLPSGSGITRLDMPTLADPAGRQFSSRPVHPEIPRGSSIFIDLSNDMDQDNHAKFQSSTYNPGFQPVRKYGPLPPGFESKKAFSDYREPSGPQGRSAGSIAEDNDMLKILNSIPEEKDGSVLEQQPEQLVCTLREHQIKGYNWLKSQERGIHKGGILADDMGLGKTVQTLALLLGERPGELDPSGTLIIAPKALMDQWKSEIESKSSKSALKVIIHHGPSRFKTVDRFKDYDVVITTYGTVGSECKLKSKTKQSSAPDELADSGVLFQRRWFRVVLDEAQHIKNRNSLTARAVCMLRADRRICLSGTPLQNSVEDIYSLFKFLQVKTLSNYSAFMTKIANPLKNANASTRKAALQRLTVVLTAVMLRRTKAASLTDLPKKTIDISKVEFGESEKKVYASIEEEMKDRARALHRQADSGRRAIDFLALLMRLRQAACHTALIGEKIDSEEVLDVSSTKDVELLTSMVSTLGLNEERPAGDCKDRDAELKSEKPKDVISRKEKLRNDWKSSAKVEYLLEKVKIVLENTDDEKMLVFSQFTSFLDIIEVALERNGIVFTRYDGKMNDRTKANNLKTFATSKACRIFLISTKCGSTGLNLTTANHVLICEPWWNPAVESQAIDRAHRIGQTKPVSVTRLIAKDSVEERIMELQRKKQELIDGALGEAALRKSSKLSVAEMLYLFGIQ